MIGGFLVPACEALRVTWFVFIYWYDSPTTVEGLTQLPNAFGGDHHIRVRVGTHTKCDHNPIKLT